MNDVDKTITTLGDMFKEIKGITEVKVNNRDFYKDKDNAELICDTLNQVEFTINGQVKHINATMGYFKGSSAKENTWCLTLTKPNGNTEEEDTRYITVGDYEKKGDESAKFLEWLTDTINAYSVEAEV